MMGVKAPDEGAVLRIPLWDSKTGEPLGVVCAVCGHPDSRILYIGHVSNVNVMAHFDGSECVTRTRGCL